MKLRTLMAVGVAAAFALPGMVLAQASGASSTGTGSTGGTPSTSSSGEPKAPTAGERPRSAASGATSSGMSRAPDFNAIDKNHDGQISRAEWDAYMRSSGSATGGATTSSGSGTTGAAAGPGPSNRTAPGSATATTPDTSGTGKP